MLMVGYNKQEYKEIFNEKDEKDEKNEKDEKDREQECQDMFLKTINHIVQGYNMGLKKDVLKKIFANVENIDIILNKLEENASYTEKELYFMSQIIKK